MGGTPGMGNMGGMPGIGKPDMGMPGMGGMPGGKPAKDGQPGGGMGHEGGGTPRDGSIASLWRPQPRPAASS